MTLTEYVSMNLVPPDGTVGRTAPNIAKSLPGAFVKASYLINRKPNASGRTAGFVPGHGGDVLWFKHDDDGSIGVYMLHEFVDDTWTLE